MKIIKDNNDIAEFAYDALGRRVSRITYHDSQTTRYYYNDKWQVLCEYDGNDIPKRWYAYGNYIDEVLVTNVISAPALCKYYVHDHLYSPVALTSAGGTVQERYEYDAYGACTIGEPNHAPRAASLYGNQCAFQGKRLDMLDDGNLELMAWPYRTYSPDIGRWSQTERLGMIPNDDQQINLRRLDPKRCVLPREVCRDVCYYADYRCTRQLAKALGNFGRGQQRP